MVVMAYSVVHLPAMVKATFFLPLADNDGRSLEAEITAVEDECFVAFGAWTLSGYFKGAWRSDTGERQLDTSAAYTVLLPAERVPELEAILRRFKAGTKQEAIYLELVREIDLRYL